MEPPTFAPLVVCELWGKWDPRYGAGASGLLGKWEV